MQPVVSRVSVSSTSFISFLLLHPLSTLYIHSLPAHIDLANPHTDIDHSHRHIPPAFPLMPRE